MNARVAVLLVVLLCGCVQSGIHVYSGKGLRKPLVKVSEDFSNEYGVRVNITFVSYSRMLAVLKHADVVIAPKRFALYNVSPIATLERVGLVKDCIPFVTRIPVIVVRNDSGIRSLQDLNGKTVVLINQSAYHVPGGCLGMAVLRAEGVEARVVYASPKDLLRFVRDGKADATIVWLDTVYGMTDGLRVIPIKRYEMRLFVAVLKENDDVRSYVRYLIDHRSVFERFGWGG